MCHEGGETARVHRERCIAFFRVAHHDDETMEGDVRTCILLRNKYTLHRCWVVVVECQRMHIYHDWLSQPLVRSSEKQLSVESSHSIDSTLSHTLVAEQEVSIHRLVQLLRCWLRWNKASVRERERDAHIQHLRTFCSHNSRRHFKAQSSGMSVSQPAVHCNMLARVKSSTEMMSSGQVGGLSCSHS